MDTADLVEHLTKHVGSLSDIYLLPNGCFLLTEAEEKAFQKIWRRYKAILIEEREARAIFIAGMGWRERKF